MKKRTKSLVCALLVISIVSVLFSCTGGGLDWSTATYKSDVTLGKGEKQVTVLIVADENSVTITINTDEAVLGDALYALGLVNDATFFDVLNGVLASWEEDQAYWAFYENGEMPNYGIGQALINGGENYKFVYTK